MINKGKVEHSRKLWLDVARGLAMFFVIYGHCSYKCDYYQVGEFAMRFSIPTFYMGMFFFCSGYLFKEGADFKTVFEQRTRTLLIPYLFLAFFQMTIGHTLGTSEISLKDDIVGILTGQGVYRIWFLLGLYVYSLLFYFIIKYVKSTNMRMVVALLLFIIGCVTRYYLNIQASVFYLDRFPCAICFMMFGLLYKSHEEIFDHFFMKVKLIITFVVILVFLLFFLPIHLTAEFYGSPYVLDVLLTNALGIPIAIYISKHWTWTINRPILFMGRNSLLLFALHFQVASLIGKYFKMFFRETEYLCHMEVMMKSISICLILYIPIYIINSYFPILIGKGYKIRFLQPKI